MLYSSWSSGVWIEHGCYDPSACESSDHQGHSAYDSTSAVYRSLHVHIAACDYCYYFRLCIRARWVYTGYLVANLIRPISFAMLYHRLPCWQPRHSSCIIPYIIATRKALISINVANLLGLQFFLQLRLYRGSNVPEDYVYGKLSKTRERYPDSCARYEPCVLSNNNATISPRMLDSDISPEEIINQHPYCSIMIFSLIEQEKHTAG